MTVASRIGLVLTLLAPVTFAVTCNRTAAGPESEKPRLPPGDVDTRKSSEDFKTLRTIQELAALLWQNLVAGISPKELAVKLGARLLQTSPTTWEIEGHGLDARIDLGSSGDRDAAEWVIVVPGPRAGVLLSELQTAVGVGYRMLPPGKTSIAVFQGVADASTVSPYFAAHLLSSKASPEAVVTRLNFQREP